MELHEAVSSLKMSELSQWRKTGDYSKTTFSTLPMDNTPQFKQVIEFLKQADLLGGETVTHVEVITDISRLFSLLQKVHITTPTRQFNAYIKQYRLKEPGETHRRSIIAQVERDYKITRQLYENFSVFPKLNVPYPIACFPELLTVVFEESPGENFQVFIQRHARGWPSRRTLNRLMAYCEQCGQWLRQFQQMLPIERHYSISEMWEYMDCRLKQLVANPSAKFSGLLRQQVQRYFEKLEARSTDLDLQMVAAHADFFQGNILVDASGVTVIDFAMFEEGSIYQDMTHFYHQLDLLRLKPIFRPHTVRQLQQAFLQGYDAHFDMQNPMFEAFRLRHITTHFLGTLRIPNPPLHERWYNRRIYRHHRRCIQRMTSD